MIVDSSALIALLYQEPGSDAFFTELMAGPRPPKMSAVNYFETALVLDRRSKDEAWNAAFLELLQVCSLEVIDVTRSHADLARAAYRRFGKGNHAARLNFGDCFAYALAQETGEPLLFKGGDFALTDVKRAL